MKILFIIPDYGSFDNFLSELAMDLLEKGWTVDVVCGKGKIIKRKDKFEYTGHSITFHYTDFVRGFNPLKHIRASKRIHHLIDDIHPDLIQVHFTTGIFTTVIGKKPSVPTIGMFHGLTFPTVFRADKRSIFKRMELFCCGRLDEIWLLNQPDFDVISKKHRSNTFKVQTKGLGCDLDKFNIEQFSIADKKSIKAMLGIEDEIVLMYSGRFVHFKGFDLVVRAFLNLVRETDSGKKYRLLLAGGFDKAHVSGLTAKEEHEMNACSQIINIGFTHETEKYLSIADVFLFPSVREGIPVCIMEALAMGVPVITANTRGCNELVLTGKNGLLLSQKPTAHELEQAVVAILADRQKLQQYSDYALKHRDELSRQHFINEQTAHFSQTLLKYSKAKPINNNINDPVNFS